MKLILFLALKDLARDKKIATFVIFLLAFSYLNLTFFPAFLNGLSNTFQNEIVNTGTSHIIIQPSDSRLYLGFESSTRKKIDLIPGVVSSSPHISMSGTAFFGSKQMSARIDALEPSVDSSVTTIHEKLLKGDFLNDRDTDKVVLGDLIAGRRLEDRIGEENAFGVSIEGLGGVDVGQKVRIRFSNGVEKEYKVKGIAGSPGFNFVSQSIYLTRKEAESVLGIEDKASSILVRLSDKAEAGGYKKRIMELGIANADIRTWEEASTFAEGINQTFGTVVFVTTFVAVIIVMSTIGIVIFINTSRKKRVIGVLKAIGMQKNQIMGVFLLESVIFGTVSTLIGMAIMNAALLYFISSPIRLPLGMLVPILDPAEGLQAAMILVVSSLIAGYLPARMAARQDILDNIRVIE